MILGFFVARNTIEAAKAQEEVVVATQTISPYTIITPEMVTLKKISKASVGDAYTRTDDVIGKANIGLLLPDEPIRPGHLKDIRYSRLSGSIPDGKVVIALPSNLELDVSKSIKQGDKIDLYAIYDKKYELVIPSAVVRSAEGMAKEESALGTTNDEGGVILEIEENQIGNYLFAVSQGARFLTVLKSFNTGGEEHPAFEPSHEQKEPVMPVEPEPADNTSIENTPAQSGAN